MNSGLQGESSRFGWHIRAIPTSDVCGLYHSYTSPDSFLYDHHNGYDPLRHKRGSYQIAYTDDLFVFLARTGCCVDGSSWVWSVTALIKHWSTPLHHYSFNQTSQKDFQAVFSTHWKLALHLSSLSPSDRKLSKLYSVGICCFILCEFYSVIQLSGYNMVAFTHCTDNF